VSKLERRLWGAAPRSQHLWRAGVYAARETMVFGLTMEPRLMAAMEMVARSHLRKQVPDRELRRKLMPHYRLGCKRILVSNDYLPALSKPNVQLVTDGIEEVRAHSILGKDGVEREVDTIIFGTGFHVTDPPAASYVRGRNGVLLGDAWKDGMIAYRGTTIAGFPNAFMITGPNTGLGHTSIVYMIESQIAYIMDALRKLDRRGTAAFDVRPEVQAAYDLKLQRQLQKTVWNSGGCQSWYLDRNGRNSTLWPSFTFRYREQTSTFEESDYEFSFTGSDVPTPEEPVVV
jgi:cation diffusion facilitator CzcD-associated flavoprotein CzcO